MIKAAFFDIDGTLLSYNTHRVSEGTLRAFERLHKAGVRTFISTGRPQALIPQFPLSFDGYVTMNGGYVFAGTDILISHPIPQADTEAFLNLAERESIAMMLFGDTYMLAAGSNSVAENICRQLSFTPPANHPFADLHRKQAFQIIGIFPPNEDARIAAMLPHCRLPRWHPAFTDIVAQCNSKAAGLEAICHKFGISREETIAFGDGGNDIEMLRWAGIGVAMGNAADEVKHSADMVTTSVDDEGIENAVNKILSL